MQHDVVSILQMSISPVVLMSAVGMLLLVMTNRFGRTIDRIRVISRELREAPPEQRDNLTAQLRILSQRARLVRAAITFAALSALLAAVLVIVLFLREMFDIQTALATSIIFISCMVCLILSLVFFLRDINVSLSALCLETGAVEKKRDS